MKTFEADTLDAFKRYITETAPAPSRPAARRKVGWKIRAAVGAAVAAATVTGIALATQTGPAAAYSVTSRSDGVVVLKIYEYRDAAALERRLSELGVRAHVTYLPEGMGCQPGRYHRVDNVDSLLQLGFAASTDEPRLRFGVTIDKKALQSNQSVVIEVSGGAEGHQRVNNADVADGPVAACDPGPLTTRTR